MPIDMRTKSKGIYNQGYTGSKDIIRDLIEII